MFINLVYDNDASKLTEKMTFFCDEYTLTYRDIIEFKRMGILKLVEETTLPDEIPCQVIVYIESATHAKYTFFNPDISIPAECYDEPLLNRNLLERTETHGGFRIEVLMPFSKNNMTLAVDTDK